MPLPSIGKPVRSSDSWWNHNLWAIEFTASGATGEVTLDEDMTDLDARVATPVADSGTEGLTSIRFPKCRRVRVVHCSIEEPTVGTSGQMAKMADILPESGSASFAVYSDAFALAHATNGSRMRILLDLDY